MEPAMKLADDCSNCNNHVQGNFNKEPCKSCLDSTGDPWRTNYPNWVAKESLHSLRVRLEEERGISGYLKAVDGPSKAVVADAINPSHYTNGGIETIDFMKAKLTPEEYRGYLRGSALKYLSRMGNKDASKQEAEKSGWYVTKLIEALR